MALRAGLRKGELLAIRWGDIQFGASEEDSDRYILVQSNFVGGKFTTPKSKKSRRVDLSRELRRTLLELRDKRMLEAFVKGGASGAEDLVFPSRAGTVLDPSNLFHYYFLPCLDHAGLRRFRFHDLRHTFGSLLIQEGAFLSLREGPNGAQFHSDHRGHLRASHPGREYQLGGRAGSQNNSATKCNSRATEDGGKRSGRRVVFGTG